MAVPAIPDLDYFALQAELGRRRFSEFIRQAWLQVEPAKPLIWNWHVDAIAEHLQAVSAGQILRLVINVPPGHAKSLSVSVLWPAWEWTGEEGKPGAPGAHRRGIFASYDADLSTRDAVRSRSVLRSEWFQRTYRPKWRFSGDQNVKTRYENDRKGFRMAIGVGGKGTGFRGDYTVVDDPLNVREQYSLPALEEVTLWWNQVMSSRLNDPMKGARVIIMQRISDRDLAAHVLRAGGYEHLCLPTEFEPDRKCFTSIGWSDPRTVRGELLFPQLFPQAAIDQAKKDLGTQGFAAQHQQLPSPGEGNVFKRIWWRYWKPAGMGLRPVTVRNERNELVEIEAEDLPSGFDEQALCWDMSFKDLKSSDFVAGGYWGRAGSRKYLLDQVHGRMDYPKTKAAVRQMVAAHPEASAKWVEDAANGPAIIADLKGEIAGLIPVGTGGGQVARARAVSPQVEAGNVYLPHPMLAAWVDGFLAEADSFPAGQHDDQVAQLSHALVQLSKTETDQFFSDFRPLGPRPAEPAEARHVVPAQQLQSWWQRMIAMAWGDTSAAYWLAVDDKQRLQVYRELVKQGMGAEEFAAAVALASAEELASGVSLTAYTAPDFFEKGLTAKSVAQRLADGFTAILGQGSAFVWAFNEDERMMAEGDRYASLAARRERNKRLRILLQGAQGDRIGGLEHLRSLLRWRPLVEAAPEPYDRAKAIEAGQGPDGARKFAEYMAQVEGRSREVLPKLLVWEECSEMVRCLSTALRDPKDQADVLITDQMIPLEALLYGALAHRAEPNRPPRDVFTAQRLQSVKDHNPNVDPQALHMAAKKAERDFDRKKIKPFTFSRLPKRKKD